MVRTLVVDRNRPLDHQKLINVLMRVHVDDALAETDDTDPGARILDGSA